MKRPFPSHRVRFMALAALVGAVLVTVKAGDLGYRLVIGIGPVAAQESQAPVEAADGSTEATTAAMTDPSAAGVADDPATLVLDELAPGDIELLQQLARRRAELDARERDFATREQALAVVEARVAERIAELKTLQETVEALVAQRDEAQEAQLASLVKIYQNMKPKDAAPIFDELEPNILLDVIDRMKEAKVAPILALMNPDRARAVTQDLARRRDMPEPEPEAAASAAN